LIAVTPKIIGIETVMVRNYFQKSNGENDLHTPI